MSSNLNAKNLDFGRFTANQETRENHRGNLIESTRKRDEPKENTFGESIVSNWTTCAVSQEPLEAPVVCDELGYLMNKRALIEIMLSKTLSTQFSHIRSLKDVYACNIRYLDDSKSSKKDAVDEYAPNFFGCPITMLPANGKSRFVTIRACGCVLSERAIKEVPSDTCLLCNKAFDSSPEARILLNPTTMAERDQMRQAMMARRASEPAPKDKKKRKKEKRKRKRAEAGGAGVHEAKKQKSGTYSSLFNKTEIGGGHTDIPSYDRLTR